MLLLNFLFSIFYGLAATIIFEFVLKANKKLRAKYYRRHEIILGYHTHHSIYGLIFILIGIISLSQKNLDSALFCIGFGIGIIIQHTISAGRFVFIEKQNKK